jgi:hypothetical protein
MIIQPIFMILGNQNTMPFQHCQLLVLILMNKNGIITNYAINHFNQNPYTRKHTLKTNYYFATEGLNYYTAFMCLKH